MKYEAVNLNGEFVEITSAENAMYVYSNGCIVWYHTPKQKHRKYRVFADAADAVKWILNNPNNTIDMTSKTIYQKLSEIRGELK